MKKIFNKISKAVYDARWSIPVPYKGYLGRKDPQKLAQLLFNKHFGRDIDFEAPSTYNEIINVLKTTTDTTLWSRLADKHLVKEYIAERGLGDTLIKSYGAWESAGDIDFDALPESFILKPNNGAGTVIVVDDKSKLNKLTTRLKLGMWLRKEYGYRNAEIHYARIKPMIIAEELLRLSDADKEISQSIIDYKWFCFNGSVSYVEVIANRWERPLHYYIYDTQWNYYPQYINRTYQLKPIPKPKCLDEMIEICQRLSQGIPLVRIDLYQVGGKVYFGEMTFTSGAGYSHTKSDEFERILAQEYYANLPK